MKSVLSLATSAMCLFASIAVASEQTRVIVMQELDNIKDRTNALTKAIQGYNGTYEYALFEIHDPAQSTAAYVKNATAELRKYPTVFSINEAFRVGGSTQDLAYAVNASVANLIKQVTPFKAVGIDTIVIGDVRNLLNASQIFSDLLLSYVSEQLRPVALGLQSQVIDSLQQGIDCYGNKTSACNDAVVDPNRTHQMALRFGAIRPDGTPIA